MKLFGFQLGELKRRNVMSNELSGLVKICKHMILFC